MDEQILVPFDDSKLGALALDRALKYPESAVTVIHVIDTRQSNYGIEGGRTGSIDEARQREAEKLIKEAEEHAERQDRTVMTVIEEGDAGDVIVEYATENDIDHVIMGSHDQSRTSRILVGHIAEIVIHNSPIPVTIVRENVSP